MLGGRKRLRAYWVCGLAGSRPSIGGFLGHQGPETTGSCAGRDPGRTAGQVQVRSSSWRTSGESRGRHQDAPDGGLFDQEVSGALVSMVTNANQMTLYPLMNAPPELDPDEPHGPPGVQASSSPVLVAVVRAGGVIDATHVEPLVAELTGAMDAGATKLLVDLSEAETVTAAGMNALLAARQRLIGRAAGSPWCCHGRCEGAFTRCSSIGGFWSRPTGSKPPRSSDWLPAVGCLACGLGGVADSPEHTSPFHRVRRPR